MTDTDDADKQSEDTWLSLSRTTHPVLRANINPVGNPIVLTEEMLIKGFEALRAYEEARRRKRIEMAPWNAEMVKVIVWLYEQRRGDEGQRLIYIVQAINEWGATNTTCLSLLDGWVAEYRASLV